MLQCAMLSLFEALLNIIAEILKVAWLPAIIAMLLSIFAKPVVNAFNLPEEPKQKLLGIIRIAGWIGTALVLLAFVLLFGGLWLAGKQAAG